MTAEQAICLADLTRPNEYEPELKLFWLSRLDGQIQAELFQTHAGGDGEPYAGDGGAERELLVGWPFDDLYVRFLVMRIDLENGELERYNNDAAAFNRMYQSYAGWYTHHHMPLTVPALRF